MQPKMGKIDIDYQVLHDAFFKNQSKPKTTAHGDVYYEGKEYEIRMKDFKPGHLSPALRTALGIQEGVPPPWLYTMQKYGPPPAYPNLKIPGVNIPMPAKSSNTQVGKFFTAENGYTIYADCHGLNRQIYQKRASKNKNWGAVQELQYEQFGADESYDSEEEDEDEVGLGADSGADVADQEHHEGLQVIN